MTANFFGIGGHSLLAARVTAMIDEVMQLPVTVRTLFEHPTISLARHLEPRVATDRASELAEALTSVDTMPDDQMRALLTEAD